MTSSTEALRRDINRVTARFALYLALDDPHRHSDSASLISYLSDLSLIGLAVEILPIVGHQLVEHATDSLLNKAVALKARLLALILSGPEHPVPPERTGSSDLEAIIAAVTSALAHSNDEEMSKALIAGENAVSALAKEELHFPAEKAREYSIAVTREIRIAISAK
jgi:hypothetical protein